MKHELNNTLAPIPGASTPEPTNKVQAKHMKRMIPTLVTVLTTTLLAASVRAERDDAAAEKLGFKLGMQSYTYRADTGHWLRAKKYPAENLKLLEGRIVSSHFKDLDEKKSDVVYGTGVADVKAMMKELKRQDFKGLLSIEYEHGDLAHLDATIPQCVAAFDKIAAEVAGK
ncbi:MAG: hypothetical protein NTW21_37300 [Verrucomicrobia bacterium]|nr:hypothetical protein [Verrucomicrobiota bacterium]